MTEAHGAHTDPDWGARRESPVMSVGGVVGLVGVLAVAVGAAGAEASAAGGHGGSELGAPVERAGAARDFRVVADTSQLATGPYSSMQMLLERTIFQVNVVDLTLRYDSATAARIRGAVEGREYSESVADTVAAAVLTARNINAHLDFRRDIGLDRFLESVRENMAAARDAGMLADSAFRRFEGELRGWYSALEGRGVKDGDITRYRIRGDSLRVVYRSAAGDTLIHRTDVGEQHRRAVIGGYLAPGVDFREGLVRSLFEGQGGG